METNIINLSRKVSMVILALLVSRTDGFTSSGNFTCISTVSEVPDSLVYESYDSLKNSIGKTIVLDKIIMSASYLKETTSPMRIKSIDEHEISMKAFGRTYPELLKRIPGIYATSETGSYGDAKINIRGFKQENISVLLNGIPISGLVSGNMYWNNWLGLADATFFLQVQKGIGASMLSDNSVGGSINIITTTPSEEQTVSGGLFFSPFGADKGGQAKGFVSYNSGVLPKGWGVSAMLSYTGGSGYVEATDVDSWAYIFNVSKKINSENRILLTVLGSPDRHEQRSVRLSKDEVDKYGVRYSKNWGYLNGKKKNLSENFYHKPYITLNHFYSPSSKIEMTNTLYFTFGDGGGRWSESKGKRIISYQKDGHIDWDSVIADNNAVTGTGASGSSINILSNYLAGHTHAGMRNNTSYSINDKLKIEGGIHYLYYSTWEKEKIIDLLGGEYWYEDYAPNSMAGVAGRNPIKHVGDYIRTRNGKVTNNATIYISGIYNSDKWNIRGGISYMWNSYRRWDTYNYVDDPSSLATGSKSNLVTVTGFSAKGGANYKLNKKSSIYLNAAAYSRIPYSSVFFAQGTNEITSGVKNERNFLSESGYRYIYQRGSLELTGYWAYWKNKTIVSNPYTQQDNNDVSFMIQGLDALHYGTELTVTFAPYRWLSFEGNLSVGHWNWKNDVKANIYDQYSGLKIDEINVYSDGLPVGDAPQTQGGIISSFKFRNGIEIDVDWMYNGRLYADFEPTDRTNPDDRTYSLKLPDYNLVNLSTSWKRSIKNAGRNSNYTLFLNIYNLLDKKYIERGKDGADHTMTSFRGYWGFGINGNIGIRVDL